MKREPDVKGIAESLALELGIRTDMGVEYLRRVLQNAMLFEKKQLDYGSGNIAVFGEKGVIVRASDKVQRLKHLVFDHQGPDVAVQNEPVMDSWDDLANYGVIGRMCADGKWK